MAILEIEDTTGKIEVAVFPQIFDKIPQKALEIDVFLRLRGKISERDGVLNFIVDEIRVGNLSEVQKSTALFIEEESKAEKMKSEVFTINIKKGTNREKIANLKEFLVSKKSDEGREVEIKLGDQKVRVPFKVEVDEKDIKAILQ